MGISVTSGRIRFTGVSNATKFDTNQETFFITNYVTGAFTIPTKTNAQLLSQSTATTVNTVATNIVSGSNVVLGALRVEGSGYSTNWLGLGGTTVIEFGTGRIDATGSIVWRTDGAGSPPVNVDAFARFAAVTPLVQGNNLRFVVDDYHAAFLSGSVEQGAYASSPFTVRYFAFCGTFDLPGSAAGTKKMKADGTGKVAVWSGAQDDNPFDDPTGNVSRVLFHSNLDNLGIALTRTGSFTLSDTPVTVPPTRTTINLATHGQSGRPVILGYVTIGGTKVPIGGSFLIDDATGNSWVCSISCNATHIQLTYWSYRRGTSVSRNYSYVIHVTNYSVNASNQMVKPDYYNGVFINSTRLRSGYFDSNNDYFYKSGGDIMPVSIGRTIDVGVGTSPIGSPPWADLGYRNKVNGYTAEYVTTPISPYPGTPAVNPTVVKVATT